MGSVSVMMFAFFLAGLSECQTGGEGNQTQTTEQTHKDPANQGLETPAISTINSTAAQASSEPPIHTVLKVLGALEEKLAATVRALEETNKKLGASEKKLSALKSKVTQLNAVDKGKPRVAFSATSPEGDTAGPLNVLYSLVYRHVLSNIGGHYSQVSGFFTAPVRGVYYFTFTSFYWGGTATSGVSLYRNGNRLVSWHGHNPNRPVSGSNSAILQLQVGDKVNVRLWENQWINDNVNKYNTFSGFLLFPV